MTGALEVAAGDSGGTVVTDTAATGAAGVSSDRTKD